MKYLVINADDFGLDSAVNAAVIQAHTTGILTSTSLLVTGPAVDEAVALARQHPRLGVGIHLCLVQGRSALTGAEFPNSVLKITGNFEAELRAQIEKFLATGLRPTHLDSHMHTHMHPRVLPVVIRLAQEYRIRWVRAPHEPFRYSAGKLLVRLARWPIFTALGRRAGRKLRAAGLQTPVRGVGVLHPGQLTENFLVQYLQHLPEGVTEIFFHPATESNAALHACQLGYQHASELQALCSPVARKLIDECSIKLVNFSELATDGTADRSVWAG
ncbi:MAG: ChbG/HpnK family deacetylase [Verrucomicrobiota bacterium]